MSDSTPAAGVPPQPSLASPVGGSAQHPQLRVLGPGDRALKRERVVDVLWALQEKRGWLDDEAIRIAAAECDLTPQEVDEVATFYNLLFREPAGRTQILVCDSISCELRGAEALMSQLSRTLGIEPGQVTSDGELCLLPIVCLGHCERAPCLLAGETVHGPCGVEPAAVEALVQKIRSAAARARQGGHQAGSHGRQGPDDGEGSRGGLAAGAEDRA